MKKKLIKAKMERKRKAFSPRNGLLTASKDWDEMGERACMNKRRHKTIQKMSKKQSLPQVKKIIVADKQLDNGIS